MYTNVYIIGIFYYYRAMQHHFRCVIMSVYFIMERSVVAGAQSVTERPPGCGFDPYSRGWNVSLHLYFHFFALALRQIAAVSSAAQHTMPPELGGKWGTVCLNTRIPLPTFLCAGYSVKLIYFLKFKFIMEHHIVFYIYAVVRSTSTLFSTINNHELKRYIKNKIKSKSDRCINDTETWLLLIQRLLFYK